MSKERALVARILKAGGVEVNGPNPWDIQVHDDRLYRRVISQGSLGLGEAYMEGWWDCDRIDLFVEKILRTEEHINLVTLPVIWLGIKARLFNLQSKSGAQKVIEAHYDLSNDLYGSFLDPYRQYSCGYFKETDNLAVAQEQKLDLICRKLQLKSTDRLLDIGCGWGGLAKFAAEKYGCSVVGITLSQEQATYAREFTKGLSVEIRKQDYRDLQGEQFDKIVSVGMMEHVGYKNYRQYFEIVSACLKPDGLFLLHTIGQNISGTTADPWLNKYIFPHGLLPSIKQLGQADEMLLVLEDWHEFGLYYNKTLLAWDTAFEKNWGAFKDKYSLMFYRMFRYYFNSCAGAFKAREALLWQIVYSKGRRGVMYESVR